MYYLGIDLGGTNIAVGIVDENLKLIRKDSTPTLAHRDASAILDDMAMVCKRIVADCNLKIGDIEYVGIAAPGAINPAMGSVEYANNLPFRKYPIVKELLARVPFKAGYIENDANAAALGEATAGAAKGTKNSVMITLGTGVGGGIIIDGKIYSGFNYAGAELGHMIIEANGRHCSCGLDGCWEAYSSATALINMTKEAMSENKETYMWKMIDGDISKVNGRTAFNAMRHGDACGKAVVDKYIDYLAIGLINIINIFSPEIVSFGGGISNEKQALIDLLLPKIENRYYSSSCERRTAVKIAELGNDAGIIGAAMLNF